MDDIRMTSRRFSHSIGSRNPMNHILFLDENGEPVESEEIEEHKDALEMLSQETIVRLYSTNHSKDEEIKKALVKFSKEKG